MKLYNYFLFVILLKFFNKTEKSEEKMNFIYQTKNNQKDNNSITEIEKELKVIFYLNK